MNLIYQIEKKKYSSSFFIASLASHEHLATKKKAMTVKTIRHPNPKIKKQCDAKELINLYATCCGLIINIIVRDHGAGFIFMIDIFQVNSMIGNVIKLTANYTINVYQALNILKKIASLIYN